MRERDVNRKLFHKGHYEVIAKRFRVALEPYFLEEAGNDVITMSARMALVNLAIEFAKRFQADNEDFDPVIFLTRCSPYPELYPLQELWETAISDETWEHDG